MAEKMEMRNERVCRQDFVFETPKPRARPMMEVMLKREPVQRWIRSEQHRCRLLNVGDEEGDDG